MITTLRKNDDGTMLGADQDGKLYRGSVVKAGLDEFDISVDVSPDGETATRTESYRGTVVGKSDMNKTAWIADRESRLKSVAGDKARELAEKAWLDELVPRKNQKYYMQVLNTEGELVMAEAKKTFVHWEAM